MMDLDRTVSDGPDRSLDLLEHTGQIGARGVRSCWSDRCSF